MATVVTLQYQIVFGKCDATDWSEWEVTLDCAEEEAYLRSLELGLPLEDVPELAPVLSAAYDEIEAQELALSPEPEEDNPFDNGWTLSVQFKEPDD